MNRLGPAILILLGLTILSLIACRKAIEVEEPCRVLSFESYEKKWNGEYDTIRAKFNYDDRGNPISIIFNKNTTGRPNYHFKYDQNGKLIVVAGLWPNSKSFDFYHKFKYDANGNMSDSMYFSGSDTSDLMKLTWSLHVRKYEFDAQGRMIECDEDIYFPMNLTTPPVHHTFTYSYDANGNLIWSGSTTFTYDDKVNFLSTHPALQLLNRDYSVNNPVPAISYNKHGLPLIFDHTLPHPFNNGRFMNIGAQNIVYSCD